MAPVFPLLAIPSFPPQLPVLLLCLSFALIPVLWPSVAMLVEENRLGTAYALMTLLQQLALWVTSALLGLCNERAQASAQHPQRLCTGSVAPWRTVLVALLAAFLLLARAKTSIRGASKSIQSNITKESVENSSCWISATVVGACPSR